MTVSHRARTFGTAVVAASLATVMSVTASQPAGDAPRIEISFPSSARTESVTGMVYVAISRDNQRPPIEQTSPTGVPLFSMSVEGLAPGAAATITADKWGHPIQSLRDIPAGEYWMQPFVNVYTRFVRADGKTVWLHMDQWEGQNWKRSPGNLYGEPVKITFDPASTTPIKSSHRSRRRRIPSSSSASRSRVRS